MQLKAADIFVFVILFLPTAGLIAYATVDQLIRFFPDDAFYYLQTAFNAAHFRVVSFDRISETNGFHPLQFFLSFIFAKISGKDALLRFAVVENAVLVLLVALVVSRHVFRECADKVRLAAMIFLSCPAWYLYVWLDAGMEMGLVLFCGVLFFCEWERVWESSFRSVLNNCWLAVFAALLILARLDMSLPLALFGAVYLFVAIHRRLPLRYVLLPAAIGAILLLPYLTWNWMAFGHLVPISGIVKANAMHDLKSNWRALSSGSHIGELIVLLPPLSAVAALGFGAVPKRSQTSFFLLATSVGVYYTYILFFAQQVFRWYLAYPLVLQCISLAFLLRKIPQRLLLPVCSTRAVWALTLVTASLQAGLYVWTSRIETTSFHLMRIATELNSRMTRRDIIGTYDAGVIGYFSVARVVNLDGLANSYEYYEAYLRPQRVGDYLHKIGATYYLARSEMDRKLPFDGRAAMVEASYRIPGQFDLELYRVP